MVSLRWASYILALLETGRNKHPREAGKSQSYTVCHCQNREPNPKVRRLYLKKGEEEQGEEWWKRKKRDQT